MSNQRGFASIVSVLLVLLVAGGLGAGAYFGYNWWQNREKTTSTTPPPPTAPKDPYAGWLTYADTENGFTLKYPPTWTTKEGKFTSTNGTTVKDTGFVGASESVYVTVRTNSLADLEAFVNADGVSDVKAAKVEDETGFAAKTADSYRIYLANNSKIYMFTFPDAQAQTDLSQSQINLMTSLTFTSTSSTTPSSTTPSDSSLPPYEEIGKTPEDSSEWFLVADTNAWPSTYYMLSKRAKLCIDSDTSNKDRNALWTSCNVESSQGGSDELPNPTFTATSKTTTQATVDVVSGGKKHYTYTLVLEDSSWYVDKVDNLAP